MFLEQLMLDAGLDAAFIRRVSKLAYEDQGVYDLMNVWLRSDEEERPEIVGDLEACLGDYAV